MMPAPATHLRRCRHCDGHSTAAITLGGRDHHGHLRTITAHCPTCHGTGTVRLQAPQAVARV